MVYGVYCLHHQLSAVEKWISFNHLSIYENIFEFKFEFEFEFEFKFEFDSPPYYLIFDIFGDF